MTKNELKSLYGENPEFFFRQIFSITNEENPLNQDFIIQKYRLTKAENDFHKGLLSHEDLSVLQNKIGYAIFILLDELFEHSTFQTNEKFVLAGNSELNVELNEEWNFFISKIRMDVLRQITEANNPMRNYYNQVESNKRAYQYLIGKRITDGVPITRELFNDNQLEKSALDKLKKFKNVINISVHSMMVGVLTSLINLKEKADIQLKINCPSSSSPKHLLSAKNDDIDFIVTADAGVYFASKDITKNYKRVLTVWEENHLAITKSSNFLSKRVLVADGTTQELHYRIGAEKRKVPNEKLSINIHDLLLMANDEKFEDTILLTYPKAQRFLSELSFDIVDTQKSAMTFGLYVKNDEPIELINTFVRLLISSFKECINKFEIERFYWDKVIKELYNVNGFIQNYGLGIYR